MRVQDLELLFTYLPSPYYLIGVALFCAGASVVSYAAFLREKRRRFWGLCLLRFFVLFLGCVIVLSPLVRYQRVVRQQRRVALLVDDSRSMAICDAPGGMSRFETACRAVSVRNLDPLKKAFVLQVVCFSEKLSPFPSSAGPAGEITALGEALRKVQEGDPPLCACVVLTDGGETEDVLPRRFPVPLWFIPVGSGRDVWNAAVTNVATEQVVLLGNVTTIEAQLSCVGQVPPEGTDCVLELGGREVGRVHLTMRPGQRQVRFRVRPTKAGEIEGAVRCVPVEGEAFQEDNVKHFFLTCVKEKLKVLIGEALPRWESTFVLRALMEDKNLAAVGCFRSAQDRVNVTGQAPAELRGLLPFSAEGLSAFHAIVLGCVTERDVGPEISRNLTAFVRSGGGLVVIGGPGGESIPPGLRALLPGEPGGTFGQGRFAVRVLRGEHPTMRGRAGELLSRGGFSVERLFELRELRPGAEVICAAYDKEGRAFPLIVVHRFGEGRVAFVATDRTYLWVLARGEQGGKELHRLLWGQLVRWVSGRKGPGAGKVLQLPQRVVTAGGEVVLRLADPSREAEVVVEGPSVRRVFRAGGTEKGRECRFRALRPGRYEARVRLGQTYERVRFYVDPNPVERQVLAVDRKGLTECARRSGGGVLEVVDLAECAARVVHSLPGTVVAAEYPLCRSPVLFLLFLALAALEWVLRRRLLTV